MRAQLKIVESAAEIKQRILESIVERLNIALPKIVKELQKKLTEELHFRIRSEETYFALFGGKLQGEFGIQDPAAVVEPIINIWVNSLVVDYDLFVVRHSSITGGITVKMVDSTYDDVLNTQFAKYVSDVNVRGYLVEWLKWLLTAGSTIINAQYHVTFNLSDRMKLRSRSRLALMSRGGIYQVDPAYASVGDENWITRALNGIDHTIQVMISEAIVKFA